MLQDDAVSLPPNENHQIQSEVPRGIIQQNQIEDRYCFKKPLPLQQQLQKQYLEQSQQRSDSDIISSRKKKLFMEDNKNESACGVNHFSQSNKFLSSPATVVSSHRPSPVSHQMKYVLPAEQPLEAVKNNTANNVGNNSSFVKTVDISSAIGRSLTSVSNVNINTSKKESWSSILSNSSSNVDVNNKIPQIEHLILPEKITKNIPSNKNKSIKNRNSILESIYGDDIRFFDNSPETLIGNNIAESVIRPIPKIEANIVQDLISVKQEPETDDELIVLPIKENSAGPLQSTLLQTPSFNGTVFEEDLDPLTPLNDTSSSVPTAPAKYSQCKARTPYKQEMLGILQRALAASKQKKEIDCTIMDNTLKPKEKQNDASSNNELEYLDIAKFEERVVSVKVSPCELPTTPSKMSLVEKKYADIISEPLPTGINEVSKSIIGTQSKTFVDKVTVKEIASSKTQSSSVANHKNIDVVENQAKLQEINFSNVCNIKSPSMQIFPQTIVTKQFSKINPQYSITNVKSSLLRPSSLSYIDSNKESVYPTDSVQPINHTTSNITTRHTPPVEVNKPVSIKQHATSVTPLKLAAQQYVTLPKCDGKFLESSGTAETDHLKEPNPSDVVCSKQFVKTILKPSILKLEKDSSLVPEFKCENLKKNSNISFPQEPVFYNPMQNFFHVVNDKKTSSVNELESELMKNNFDDIIADQTLSDGSTFLTDEETDICVVLSKLNPESQCLQRPLVVTSPKPENKEKSEISVTKPENFIIGRNSAFNRLPATCNMFPKTLTLQNYQGQSKEMSQLLELCKMTFEKMGSLLDAEISLASKFGEIGAKFGISDTRVREGSINPVANLLTHGDEMVRNFFVSAIFVSGIASLSSDIDNAILGT